jgi:hypothetical protein
MGETPDAANKSGDAGHTRADDADVDLDDAPESDLGKFH